MELMLIISDDQDLGTDLRGLLEQRGILVTLVRDTAEAVEQALAGDFDLILVDLPGPSSPSFDLPRRVRSASNAAILVLTANVGSVLPAIENGADDFLRKPCNPWELMTRIRAALRRRSPGRSGRNLSAYGFEVNRSRRTVHFDGRPLPLTRGEFRLLQLLLGAPGKVLSREQLSQSLYLRPVHPFDRRLDMLVSRLRRKLDELDSIGHTIETIRGAGYMFVARTEAQTVLSA